VKFFFDKDKEERRCINEESLDSLRRVMSGDAGVIGVGGASNGRRASFACCRILSMAFRSHSAI